MPIPSSAGCAVLREVVSALEGSDLKYWVGRGVFRHYRVAREFGDKQNDIDLHVLEAEREKVVGLVGHLCERGYERVPWNDRGYKIPLVKGMVPVELIFLEGKIGGLSFRAGGVGQKRYTCPIAVYGNRRLKICGVKVRVPRDQYLPRVYGPNWEAEEKDNGGDVIK